MEVCRYGLSGSQLQTVTNSPSVWVSVRVCVCCRERERKICHPWQPAQCWYTGTIISPLSSTNKNRRNQQKSWMDGHIFMNDGWMGEINHICQKN